MKILKKCLVLVLMFGLVISSSLQVNADDTKYIRGTFTFGAHDNNHDLTDSYIYTDDFFKESAYNDDLHLAIMSMVMASASISSKDVDYPEKSKNIQDLLSQIGFEDIEVNEYYRQKMELNTMGVAVAHKSLDDNTVLLAIVPRSAGYESEWGGNFNIGSSGLHSGFETGRDIISDFTKNYVSGHSSVFEGKTVKVWTMGYSRGAGVANLIGAGIGDNSNEFIGLDVSKENIYDYTFGTPLTASTDLNPSDEKYNYIHNYYADYDMVAMLPMVQWGFDRYGTTTYLDVHNADTKAKMLSYLQVSNPAVYEHYTTYDDPDNYQAKTLDYNSETGSFTIVNDDTRTVSLKDFVSERLAYLAEHVKSRDNYSSYYETAMTHATALLVGGDDEVVAQFMAGASKSSSLKPLAVMLFFYNWIDQYVANREGTLPEGWIVETINRLVPLEDDATTGNETMDEILKSDFYKEIYQNYVLDKIYPDGSAATIDTYQDLLDYYKNLSGYYMKIVLSDGLRAIGYSEEDIAKHTMIVDDNPTYLSVVAAYALFGTNDSASTLVEAGSAAINKAKTALTLVGNSCYLRVHNNEVILSWLRAMDTNPLPSEDTTEPEETTEPDNNNNNNNPQDITNIPCEDAYGKNWTWSEKKGQCVYRVTNTRTK